MASTPSNALYIASSSFSGSTLLGLLLGAHPAVRSVGEVFKLSFRSADRRCACGAPVASCSYWTSVRKRLAFDLGIDPQGFAWDSFPVGVVATERHRRIFRRLPTREELALLLGRSSLLRVVGGPTWPVLEQAARNSWQLFDVIAAADEVQWVVDSSKNAVRLKSLYMARPRRLRVVHLVRDGRAVAASAKRRGYKSVSRRALAWKKTNRNISLMLRTIPRGQRTMVRYEDLCRDPRAELCRLCAFLGIDYRPSMQDLRDRVFHDLPGNPILFSRVEKIRRDDRWRTELSQDDLTDFQKVAGRFNARLGYTGDPIAEFGAWQPR